MSALLGIFFFFFFFLFASLCVPAHSPSNNVNLHGDQDDPPVPDWLIASIADMTTVYDWEALLGSRGVGPDPVPALTVDGAAPVEVIDWPAGQGYFVEDMISRERPAVIRGALGDR